MRVSVFRRYVGIGLLLVAAIAVVACTSAKVTPIAPSASPLVTPTPSPTPTPTPTPTLPSSAIVQVWPGPSNPPFTITVAAVAASGTSLVAAVPAATPVPGIFNAYVTEAISASAPSGVSAYAMRRDITHTTIVYVEFSSTTPPITFPFVPAFAFTLPSTTAGESYYLAYYNGAAWVDAFDGPATVSGDSVTFASSGPQAVPMTATQPAFFALYESP